MTEDPQWDPLVQLVRYKDATVVEVTNRDGEWHPIAVFHTTPTSWQPDVCIMVPVPGGHSTMVEIRNLPPPCGTLRLIVREKSLR